MTRLIGRLLPAVSLVLLGCASGPQVPYVARDPSLRKLPLYFYPAVTANGAPPAAFIFFLGNDVGFWKPHQELCWRLSKEGYAVVGLDLKKWLAPLPSKEPQRDSAFAVDMPDLLQRVRHEMGADSAPAIVAGHSFGAEVAFWIAWHKPPPRLVGVLALSPRGSGHLTVTPFDLLNYEASGRWSFSTIQAAHDIASSVRIAVVRGGGDKFEVHDSAFVANGAGRLRVFGVPFAGHSLMRLVLAGPIVERAVKFLLSG